MSDIDALRIEDIEKLVAKYFPGYELRLDSHPNVGRWSAWIENFDLDVVACGKQRHAAMIMAAASAIVIALHDQRCMAG